LELPLLEITYPVYHRSVLDKSYAGVKGAVTFAEDYITEIKNFQYEKRKKLLLFVNGA
jgi:nitrogenase molybdenum-iron protein beta chain